MAKIKHNNFLDTVDAVMTNAKNQGALHLYAEGESFNGRKIMVKGKELYHFGTTGYLGLEQDRRLKQSAISAIERYGTQFPLSKSYISHPLYAELEEKIEKMYGLPSIITKNSTLGHMAVIPSMVGDRDAVILDHQVHWSVQNAVQFLKNRSVRIEMVRHNRLDMLEDKIRGLRSNCEKIWYMADGVYSMFGDYAPVRELIALSKKYPQLHLYFDDVHGMSWKGRSGTGFVMSELEELPENVVLFGTLSKTFGANGSMMICSDQKLYNKVKTFGGPLTFSAQLDPASVAAAIASADIHLTDEIYELQNDLAKRINSFNRILASSGLPLVEKNDSPVFYIGTGMPVTGYNLVNRLMKDGFYVNLGIFPAVPVKNTGLRITLSLHNKQPEITELASAISHHLPKALEETSSSLDEVKKAFNLASSKLTNRKNHKKERLKVDLYTSIRDVNKKEWNAFNSKKSTFDWEGLNLLESAFKGNRKKEYNWSFHYLIIRDGEIPILMSFFTCGLWKDDMLFRKNTSIALEKERLHNAYYKTSRVLSMGSLFTEGEHLYLDKSSPKAQEALVLMIRELEQLSYKLDISSIVLRDFESTEAYWNSIFQDRGFIKFKMPDSCYYDDFSWHTEEEYLKSLSSRSRRHLRREVLDYRKDLKIQIKSKVSEPELEHLYQLYTNVKENNLELNTFEYPRSLFKEINNSPLWEFIIIGIQSQKLSTTKPVGVMFCYKNMNTTYTPNLVGLDYGYSREYGVYRQLLYQTILRAKETGFQRIDFGITAIFEKRKFGAKTRPISAYLQAKDNFNLESLEMMQAPGN